MAGFNPFAPNQQPQSKAPQLQGIQAPNVGMQQQSKPSLLTQLGPTLANKAMDSEAAGAMGNALKTGAEGVWSSLTAPAAASVTPVAAAAAPVVASVAPVAASTAATAAATGPAALMAGPFAPLVIGAGLMAANSGK